mgnify:FL=1
MISVIVPVYNVEKYIEKCLKSLVEQTLKNIEIIIVNDGSTDNSKKIISKFAEKYSNIKYYEKTNGGLSSARNYGIKYANGEYVAFLDSDDYVEKNLYELMYKKALQENSDMVECDFIWEYYGKNGEIVKTKKDKRKKFKTLNQYVKNARVVAWNKLIKKQIIDDFNIRFPEGLIYEDIEFFYKLFPHLNKISYVNIYGIHYVQRNGSILNSNPEKIGDIFKILDNVIKYYRDLDIYENEMKYRYRRILLGSSMKRILKIKDKKMKKNFFLKTLKSLNMKQKNEKKSIVFGITKLDIGGAERVLVDIINNISDKFNITVFTIYSGGILEKELNHNVKIVSLYQNQNRVLPLYILLNSRKIYNKFIKNNFDIEVAFLEGPITRIFRFKNKKSVRKIAWVHNDITKVFGNNIKAKIKKKLDKSVYKNYDEIVFVSNENKNSFKNLYGNIGKQIVIYNYLDKNRIIEKSKENKEILKKEETPIFVTVARLTKQKGIDRLIKVHKRIIDDGIKHKIYVIGDGVEKDKLKKLIKQFKIEKSFILLGKKENPYCYIKSADYFCLLSLYEGYGMVIEEAKIFNKPILITKTAAVEAVRDYEKSLIIENNEEDIYDKLKKVLLKKIDIKRNIDRTNCYDNSYILNEIQNLFD